MKLLLVRHGQPADRQSFSTSGHADELRPLSAEGRRRMRSVAVAIAQQVQHIDVLASSPFARAVETAALIARSLGKIEPIELPTLCKADGEASIVRWLAAQPEESTVALVGHEPMLGRLAALLLMGVTRPMVRLKHGGAMLLRFSSKAKTGSGSLAWLLQPRQLHWLAR